MNHPLTLQEAGLGPLCASLQTAVALLRPGERIEVVLVGDGRRDPDSATPATVIETVAEALPEAFSRLTQRIAEALRGARPGTMLFIQLITSIGVNRLSTLNPYRSPGDDAKSDLAA